MWWMMWRAPVHHVVDDEASTGYNVRWMTWRAPVYSVVDGVAISTVTLEGMGLEDGHVQVRASSTDSVV